MALRVAIVLERWKLAIFEAALDRGGFTYEQGPGVTKDTLTLTVETNEVMALQSVVRAATTTAAETKNRKVH